LAFEKARNIQRGATGSAFLTNFIHCRLRIHPGACSDADEIATERYAMPKPIRTYPIAIDTPRVARLADQRSLHGGRATPHPASTGFSR